MGRIHDALKKAEREREKKRRDDSEDVDADKREPSVFERAVAKERGENRDETRKSETARVERVATLDAPVKPSRRETGRSDDDASKLIAFLDPTDYRAEQFRALKTNLHVLDPEPEVIGLTSAVEGEDTDVVCANLACVFAEEQSRDVLVVDADLRDSGLHRLLGLDAGSEGLADVLDGRREALDVIQQTKVPHVYCVTAGSRRANPGGLISSSRVPQIIAAWRERFSRVIIDTPPILSVSDAAVLGHHLDGLLITLKLASTPRDLCDQAIQTLISARIRLLGCVLTNAEFRAPRDYDDS